MSHSFIEFARGAESARYVSSLVDLRHPIIEVTLGEQQSFLAEAFRMGQTASKDNTIYREI